MQLISEHPIDNVLCVLFPDFVYWYTSMRACTIRVNI